MPKLVHIASNLKYFMVDEFNIASEVNSVQLGAEASVHESATYDSAAKTREPGVISTSLVYSGFDTDHVWWDRLGNAASKLVSAAPLADGSEGDPVLLGEFPASSYELTGQFDAVEGFSLSLLSDDHIVRGKVLRQALGTAETSDGNGSEIELSTSTGDQRLHAAIFLTEFTGTDITFTIESDATGFASPTTRITFDQFTDVGAQFSRSTAEITPDDFYRIEWSGTFSSAKFFAVAGIR